MNLVRSPRAGEFEIKNDKTMVVCNGWTQVSSDKAAEAMERGYSFVVETSNDTRDTAIELDKRKLRAIASGKCKMIIPQSYEIYTEIKNNKVSIATTRKDKDDSEVRRLEHIESTMKYILIYLNLGLNVMVQFPGYRTYVSLHVMNRVTMIDLNKDYAEKVGRYEVSSNELYNYNIDRINKRLREGMVTFDTDRKRELYLDIGKKELEEILIQEGITI